MIMYFLTQQGAAKLDKWLSKTVRGYEMHDKDAWTGHAEAVALTAAPNDDFVIEVNRHESTTGNPETLTMPRQWFKHLAEG
jgi:hypothetical protein